MTMTTDTEPTEPTVRFGDRWGIGRDVPVSQVITEITPADYCQDCGFPAADCECAWHAAWATAYRLSQRPTTTTTTTTTDD
jgi:hypothetical protein